MKRKRIFITFIALVLVMGIAGGSFYVGTQYGTNPSYQNDATNKYNTISELIHNKWLNYLEIDNIDEALLKGMVKNLNDPYTEYLEPKQAQEFTDSLNDDYHGIGIMVDQNGVVEVVQLNSPAKEAGIQKGDRIVRVDDTDINNNEDLKEVLHLKEDNKVTITVSRNNQSHKFLIDTKVQDGTVIYDVISEGQEQYGYIVIRSFGTNTANVVNEALAYFQEQHIENLVLDLRDNLGGYMDSAFLILDTLFDKDETLCLLQEANQEPTEYKSKNEIKYRFVNGTILVNEYTASASEILAGCLQEKLDYQLVGTNTYGKGIAQTIYTFSDMSVLKYTFAAWMLPSGKQIQGEGLKVNERKELDSLRYTLIV